jgi:flagellar biosynthesis chaperone FliJ
MQAIEATQQRLAAAKQRQTDIRQKADALRGQGKVVPGMLVDELNEYGRDVDRLQADLKSKQRELRHTVDKYEVEKRRWRELTAPRQAPGDR